MLIHEQQFPDAVVEEQFDAILDPIGPTLVVNLAPSAPHGRIVVYGTIANFKPVTVSANDLLMQGQSLLTYKQSGRRPPEDVIIADPPRSNAVTCSPPSTRSTRGQRVCSNNHRWRTCRPARYHTPADTPPRGWSARGPPGGDEGEQAGEARFQVVDAHLTASFQAVLALAGDAGFAECLEVVCE